MSLLLAMAAPVADASPSVATRLPFVPVHSTMRIELNGQGEVASCKIDAQGAVPPDFTDGACEAFQEFGILSLLLGADRNRLSATSIVLDMGPVRGAAAIPVAAGTRLAAMTADYAVAPDGKLAGCTVTSRQGAAMSVLDLCEMAFSSGQQFENGSGDRRGTISFAVYGEMRPGG
jgi:hypothetical protein